MCRASHRRLMHEECISSSNAGIVNLQASCGMPIAIVGFRSGKGMIAVAVNGRMHHNTQSRQLMLTSLKAMAGVLDFAVGADGIASTHGCATTHRNGRCNSTCPTLAAVYIQLRQTGSEPTSSLHGVFALQALGLEQGRGPPGSARAAPVAGPPHAPPAAVETLRSCRCRSWRYQGRPCLTGQPAA